MKSKTAKLLSILLALVMMAGLLPLGQVAYAYSEGDIPGTTGTGTVTDPIIVDNFAELKAACGLATFGAHLYIKFENKTVEETLPFDAPSLTSAIRLNTGYVHLILDGSYVFKANHIENALYGHFFEVASGGFLEISGNGKLSFSPMLTGATNAVILVSGGTVEINSGHLDGHPLNWAVWGRAIAYRTGKLTINGGTFTGYNDQSNPDSVDAVAITPPSSASGNFVKINGGTFSSSSKNTPTEGCFGLSVWGTSTFNKYEVIKLAGGIFDGIEVNVGEAKIGDILEEGYHTYYAGSGNIAPAIEALKASTEKIKIDKNTYTIYFDRNGGSGEMSSITVNKNDSYTIPVCGFNAPSDMAFQNWYLIDADANSLIGEKNPYDVVIVDRNLILQANWTDDSTPTLAFTTQPQSGTAKKTESYTFTWALNDTPDSIHLQRWIPADNMWATGTNLNGLTSSSESFADFIVDGNVSKYRIRAIKGSETIYSNEFTVTWTEDSAPTAPTITTTTLSDGKVGTAYEQTLAATGDAPITWTIESGNLPDGLTLGSDGKISGTPTMAGDYTFTVKATNGAGDATQSYTVTIAPADAVTYTVSFNANSGGGTMADVTVNAGEKLTLPECSFTPPSTDKEFDKWDAGNPGDKVEIIDNCTITAIWKDKAVMPITVTEISIKTPASKTEYTVGEALDVSGLTLDVEKSNGTHETVSVTPAMVSGFDSSAPAASQTLTITYEGKTVTYNVSIKAPVTPPSTITYTVTVGGNSTWTKGSTNALSITVKRSEDDENCIKHFTGVEIDGTALSDSDYEATSGSTVVTIKAAALEKLSAGKHTVTVKFDDGSASTSLTVKAASGGSEKPTSPKTGDESNMGLWMALAALSMAGFAGIAIVGRKGKAHR